ncbi:hypothetical protein SAMN04489732_13063, partial [Amycolatopsis saalfeldensis]
MFRGVEDFSDAGEGVVVGGLGGDASSPGDDRSGEQGEQFGFAFLAFVEDGAAH